MAVFITPGKPQKALTRDQPSPLCPRQTESSTLRPPDNGMTGRTSFSPRIHRIPGTTSWLGSDLSHVRSRVECCSLDSV